MELRDLLVTPIVLIVLYMVAYIVRPYVTDPWTKRYFIPALTARFIGALALGFIYQFYYNGGDTYNYHTHGSHHIWEAFWESPQTGLKLLFADGTNHQEIYRYSSKILFFSDFSSYNVVRIAALCDILTFSTYSATALLFAVFSFVGLWMFYQTFYKRYPHLHRSLAIACLFIPSVFFWGSGLLKDTITIGFLGIATYFTSRIFNEGKFTLWNLVFLIGSLYGLYCIKIYVLLNFLPAAIFWAFLLRLKQIQSVAMKVALLPFVIAGSLTLGIWAVVKASEDNPKYAINMLAKTARTTAYDIRYYTGRDAGSGYTLGDLDGTVGSLLLLGPSAINVSLFRPYFWEVKNPLMLLSAIESFLIFVFALWVVAKNGIFIFKRMVDPDILFGLVFSISFAFAVGVSTYNFGTLVRYKIPLMPFFTVALLLLYEASKRDKKLEAFDPYE
jgi:hypothetical protein